MTNTVESKLDELIERQWEANACLVGLRIAIRETGYVFTIVALGFACAQWWSGAPLIAGIVALVVNIADARQSRGEGKLFMRRYRSRYHSEQND
jgi:hypothetical protein